ncbi:phosphatase PAP2 family protein [Allostreptomyces psammosilenae]|uniref:Undecaprenyl-diphosphatase n=1 Tax=Allostreptomyces psammosilenae TaxID=1892865 RepID=A0A853AA49_9ACTN|nr:phosphatase PAP2 family protein [Allostreptomyces psammosilenae]NYI07501.1 undecaprenyl-diphosphatase [Allostreptomyces psammosilenae]
MSVLVAAEDLGPDVALLRGVNDVARATEWAHGPMAFLGEYGLPAVLFGLALYAWWRARTSADPVRAVAAVLWAPLAAGVALVVNVPIREVVQRPRPFVTHPDLTVLVHGKEDYTFVSDHSTLVMAIAVGLLLVDRRIGVLAVLVAAFQGFGRLYVGVHYPTDVLGGFALGTAVVLLLATPGHALCAVVVRALLGTPLRPLVAAGGGSRRPGRRGGPDRSGDDLNRPQGVAGPSVSRPRVPAAGGGTGPLGVTGGGGRRSPVGVSPAGQPGAPRLEQEPVAPRS